MCVCVCRTNVIARVSLYSQEPLTKEIEHRFNVCCLICCWESKPFRMVVTLPKSGFVPNEVIDIDVDLKNPSTEHISGIWVYIIRKMEAHANDGNSDSEKKDTELIFKMLDGVRNGNDKRVKGQIVVPDVPPTDTTTSTIFKVSYIMRVRNQRMRFEKILSNSIFEF